MSFKENLRQKVKVDRLSQQVINSIGSVSGGFKINKADMRTLLELAGYHCETRRGLEMYAKDFTGEKPTIVLLDNELKIYETDVEDVLIRKNPFLGEMVKIRNIRKILNDKDVVVSSRSDTVKKIRREILESIDLTFTTSDIDGLYQEGVDAIENDKPEDLVAVLAIFAEILGLAPPESNLPGDLAVFGYKTESVDDWMYGPVYIYSLPKNLLHRYNVRLTASGSQNPAAYKDLIDGKTEPDTEGIDALDELREKALTMPEKKLSIN